MVAAPVHLTTGTDTANVGAYSTASIAPTSGRPIYAAFMPTGTSPVPKATLTGCGLTWTEVVSTTVGARVLQIFEGTGTPTSGALTFSAIGGGTPWTSGMWQVVEWDGADTAAPIAQSFNSRPAAATSVNEPFGNTVTAGNATWAVVAVAVASAPIPGSGWTDIGSFTQSAPLSGFLGMVSTSAAQQNITASWTGSSASFVVGLEIASATAPVAGAALSGSGSLSAGVTPAVAGAAALSGAGTLAAAASPSVARAAALSGGGTLTAQGLVSRAAALSGTGTLSVAQQLAVARAAALSGSGTLAAQVFGVASVALSGAGSLTAAAQAALARAAALSGTGTLSATQRLGVARAAALSGSGTLAAAAALLVNRTAALSGAGSLIARALFRLAEWTGATWLPVPSRVWDGTTWQTNFRLTVTDD